eukprot:TRINITY_DN3638_c0_g1_i2.p1 TRINITY_DN3638_c0_g1~~TRINITY_DN3638_c0_g1_i2.p1  ORF type:complete len:106 (-),score=12.58 TRINITY_DN3638_c0_g1_i2:130-447(-)
MFSLLAGGSRIKPHTGQWNARLTFHLGLVIPPGCSIRVGKEERLWAEGEVLVFDDSYEHEAVNPSGEERAILLVDVWHPSLSPEEIVFIRRLYEIFAEQQILVPH